jgi:hypothetical protein
MVISPGITSPWMRIHQKNGFSTGHYQLMEDESTGGIEFR